MSKLPFIIADERGLYQKYGLDVELRFPELGTLERANVPESLWSRAWQRVGRKFGLIEPPRPPDIDVDGHGPVMITLARGIAAQRTVALAATDCSMRYYVVGQKGMTSLEELKGKRLGIGSEISTSGFTALWLVQRMGWERGRDISIVRPARFDELRDGLVDAIVGGDDVAEAAEKAGYPILEDTRSWNEQLAGNSARVAPDWLENSRNREAARRFLRAVAEAVALFHERPDIVFEVMAKRFGVTDRSLAKKRYLRSDYVPRKPYPCREGIRNVMDFYHIDEMVQYANPETFYDDSLMRELDESGFIDALYD